MRLTTEVWAKFESKGRPGDTKVIHDQIGLVARQLLSWLVDTAMGHCLRITVARTQDELERLTRPGGGREASERSAELLGDFEAALAELGFGTVIPPSPETICEHCGGDSSLCQCAD
jgi:hypothetical protein